MKTEYSERERQKTLGWAEFRDDTQPLSYRKACLLKVIEAHYERSVAAWRKPYAHGDWPAYVRSWLAANGDRTDLFPPRNPGGLVIKELRKEFPPPAVRSIRLGYSYWE